MNEKTQTVLITGASSGIGLNLAREFARHGHPLVLVAPDEAELAEVSENIRQESGVSVETMACDLRDEDAIDGLIVDLEADGVEIDILCNNAGVGFRGNFWEIPEEDHLSIVRLNVEAVVRLTRALLPPMIQRGHGRLLNTASVAGFEPGPLLASYHASKAFVLSLTESLATELEDTPITVTALCPGPVDTDFMPKADLEESKAFQKGPVMAPQDVAAAAYKALMAGDRVVVPGGANKAMVFARRFTSEKAQAKMIEKMYEDVDTDKITRARGDIEDKSEAERN